MNPRRDFFRKIFVGAAALPVVVKAAMSELLRGRRRNGVVLDEHQWTPNPEWDSATHVFANEYMCEFWDEGIKYGLDKRPMRVVRGDFGAHTYAYPK